MIRGLAAALAISLQRIFLGLIMALLPGTPMEFAFSIAIGIAACVCIVCAELYVRWIPQPKPLISR